MGDFEGQGVTGGTAFFLKESRATDREVCIGTVLWNQTESTLYWIRDETGNQWRSWRRGEMRSVFIFSKYESDCIVLDSLGFGDER